MKHGKNEKTTVIPSNTLHENRFVSFCSNAAVILVGLIFAVLSVFSVLQTCRIDRANLYAEIINYDKDNIFLNIMIILAVFIVGVLCFRKKFDVSKVKLRIFVFAMLIVTTLVSTVWVLSVRSVPSGDCYTLVSTALNVVKGEYKDFFGSYDYYGNHSYYLYYPFQLGYVFVCELLFRVFGTSDPVKAVLLLQIVNIIALNFLYLGLVFVTQRIFNNKAVSIMTALALTLCFQPMLMTTFTYGIIIGLACAVWSVYFVVRYIGENRLVFFIPATVLMCIAVVAKYNNMIILAACVISLLLHTIGKKRLLSLLMAAVLILCPILSKTLVINSYESRSNTTLDTEVSQLLYAYMGISDSQMAPGWYNGLAMMTLRDADLDEELASQSAKQGIKSRLEYFSDNKKSAATFFLNKAVSQWNEPSYESVWISEVRDHNTEQLNAIAVSAYCGKLSKLLDFYFNAFQMMVFIGFAAGMAFLFIKKKANSASIILPVAVLGGFLYHMIFEGKSQYVLSYFILLIPFAVFGIYNLCHLFKDLLKKSENKAVQ